MDHLFEFCKTDTQKRTIEAVIEHGSNRKAAKALGVTRRNIDKTVNRVKAHANTYHSHGFNIKGKSTLYDSDGNIKIEWVKTERDKERHDLLLESITESFGAYKGASKLIKPPKSTQSDLLTIYPMGDPHIGLYAWSEECGEDFDCDIAERDLIKAVTTLVSVSPPSGTALILNLGDFFHTDNQLNRTAKSGNALDVDSRYGRVLQIGIKIMVDCIYLALQKHKNVIVKNVIGNHDEHTSLALSAALAARFHNNKRVNVIMEYNEFWYYRFGNCLFGTTHGEKVKPDRLPLIMANDRAQDWGLTEYRYFHTGHIHHDHVKDMVGCRWESHRTLAAKDAWHSAQGYRSQRDMKSITYHKEYGEDSRHTMSIRRIRATK